MKLWISVRSLVLAMLIAMVCVSGCGAAMEGAMAPPAEAAKQAEDKPALQVAADRKATTWKRSQIHANNARLAIGDRDELPLVGAEVMADVDGFRARVVIDYYFLNDRDGRFEGNFQLRLPSDASPYYFAFGETVAVAPDAPSWINRDPTKAVAVDPASIREERASTWTAPQEARMVPKQKAARAYADTVRRRVDPGVVEWAGAGVFNARVFPLAPRKLHRIVVAYDVDLVSIGDDLELALDLPEHAKRITADLSVMAPQQSAVSVTPSNPGTPQGARRRYRFENPKEGTVSVRLSRPGSIALAGTDPRTGPYFAAAFRPDVPVPPKEAQSSDAAVVLVDTSLSSNPDRFNVWLILLEALLEKNRDVTKRFAVLFFNVETRWYQPAFLDNTPENVAALLAYARTLSLEGATDLGAAMGEAAHPRWLAAGAPASWDVFLLSDGAATWGESDGFALSRKLQGGHARALYAYQTGMAGTDGPMLDNLAREGRGAVFSVVGESEVPKAATAHRSRPFEIVSITAPGISDLIVAGRPRTLFPGQRLTLAGRGTLPENAEVILTLRRDGVTREVRSRVGSPLPSLLAPRVYGQIAVAQLEELGAPTETMATSYATYFRVTGQTCSLLLLESEADYQRNGVVPEEPGAIQRSAVASTIERILTEAGASLGDPKARFFAWLDSLNHIPGVSFALPRELRGTLQSLPSEAFLVESQPLEPKIADKNQISADYQKLLASHELDYDVVVAEAQRRRREGSAADSLKALSSLVEERPGDSVLARDVAFSAMASGYGGHAYQLFRRVAAARPWEPQTYRAMAGCLVKLHKIDLAIALFEVALAGQWDGRFGDFRQIVSMEYLHLLRQIAAGSVETRIGAYARARMPWIERDAGPARADLVVMITWNTDNTDVDLHVIEPSGTECYYGNRSTWIGGELTKDVTQGYGPEMYVLPKAISGEYQIRAHYYASDRNRASARTKVQALVFEDWGSSRERVTEKLVTLEYGKDQHDIAAVWR